VESSCNPSGLAGPKLTPKTETISPGDTPLAALAKLAPFSTALIAGASPTTTVTGTTKVGAIDDVMVMFP
jgi:hypothetical protein